MIYMWKSHVQCSSGLIKWASTAAWLKHKIKSINLIWA